jgi:hypothetical protein
MQKTKIAIMNATKLSYSEKKRISGAAGGGTVGSCQGWATGNCLYPVAGAPCNGAVGFCRFDPSTFLYCCIHG